MESVNRRLIEEEQARKVAQEEARRQAEQRTLEEAERQRRGAAEARREEPARPAHGAGREKEKPEPRGSDDARPKFGGRQELHIAGDVSARHKKKKPQRFKGRSTPSGEEQRHGFEKPTAPIVRDVVIGETRHVRNAWSYEAPQPKMEPVRDRFGFWKDVAVG